MAAKKKRKSTLHHGRRRNARRVKVAAPMVRRNAAAGPWMIPTRWVKFVVAHFSPAALRDPDPDIFHRLRPRHRHPTALGRRGILVLLVRRGSVADRFLRPAAPDAGLRLRPRTDPRALGLADGRTRQPVPGRPRRRPHRDGPEQFLDRARALFFPALQHHRHRRFTARSVCSSTCSRTAGCSTPSSA